MVKGITIQVAARVPLSVVEFMDKDIGLNNFMNRAEWVQCACREYMKIRQAELSRDALGGGDFPKIKGWITAFAVIHRPLIAFFSKIAISVYGNCVFAITSSFRTSSGTS